MSNYDGIGSHSQTQSNSSPNAQTVDMDGLNDQVSGDRLENVEHYFEDNIDVELEEGMKRKTLVFSITVDNASSNDGAIAYLKKKFDNWGQNILGGRYVHMRCMAHIVNLVIQGGLKGKDEHEAISRIRGAIRWNSTYLMLETAISLKRAFDAYEDVDLAYKNDLLRQPFDGIPTDYDWERAKVLKVRDGLHELFNDYKLRYGHSLQGTPGSPGSSFSRVSSSSSSSVGTSMQFLDHEALVHLP
ncbi:UNVERIFIED_CONTAM: hypothetical protein Sradi_1910500 [Sesamum radiatum]|uniref:Transposase n=1 Tax=Sesamum radiatum TaxID=300843 RepID=A0AAW2TXM9_SESRA